MLNMDFSQHIVIDTNDIDWLSSPAAGVLRKPLARAEQESGHATSIVRYEPGSKFKSHPHPLGEEILVLEGVFSDETGDYGKGSYIRNPPGSHHAPLSEEGCVIFVKLHQFSSVDKQQFVIDTVNAPWQQQEKGKQVLPLHQYKSEHVCLIKLEKGTEFVNDREGGEEVFIVSGRLDSHEHEYCQGTWIRNGSIMGKQYIALQHSIIWLKTGHLSSN